MCFRQRPLMSPVVLQILSRVNQGEMIGGLGEPIDDKISLSYDKNLLGKRAGAAPIFFRWTRHL